MDEHPDERLDSFFRLCYSALGGISGKAVTRRQGVRGHHTYQHLRF